MKQVKLIVAFVTGLFAFTSVQAGELSVSGSMQATYQSEQTTTTGNPLGINTDITLSGSTDTDFGTVTMSLATDGTFLSDSGADHKYSLATGIGTFSVANSGDAANAVDDITPSAFEEANGSGSGSYGEDFGSGMEGSMSLGYKNGDLGGTGISIAYDYYPKLDGTTNAEKKSTADTNAARTSAQSVNVGIPLSGLPVLGDTPLGGAKITLGYNQSDSTVAKAQAKEGGTVAVVLPVGPLKVGFQKKAYAALGTANTEVMDTFYKDDILGVAYAVNDDFALSYNLIESVKHNHTAGQEIEQETKAINLAYTVGGLTLGFQDAKTKNSGWSTGTDNDTRTFSIKTAF
jgi:hypothetical protein|tara:strand:- start:425 stop:1462 length:1038 start_codon:yes stop_codon:yes gene_type:complete